MDITNNDMAKEICGNLNLMLSFAEKAGIFEEGIPNYCVTRNSLSYTTSKCGVQEEIDELNETVRITLDKTIDRVKVKKETRYIHGFIFSEENPNCQNYCTVCHQVITEFQVKDDKLDVTTGSITQTIFENTLFSGTETIVDFDSIAEFKTKNQESLPSNHSEIKIDTESYSIPEDYHITDGVGPINNRYKIKKKTN